MLYCTCFNRANVFSVNTSFGSICNYLIEFKTIGIETKCCEVKKYNGLNTVLIVFICIHGNYFRKLIIMRDDGEFNYLVLIIIDVKIISYSNHVCKMNIFFRIFL